MKVSTEACLKKMRVLAGQEFFVRDDILLGCLARRICAVAENAAHIDRMLDLHVGRTKSTLHISEVEALASETAGAYSSSGGLPDACERCRATEGVCELVERDGQTVAQRCGCERGRRLAAMDSDRKTKVKVNG